MANIKPTFKEPISPQSKEFEKDFKKTMVTNNLNIREAQESLNEIDGMLSEVEQSLKKKIFSLAKMESLVFSDPKLSSVYDGMAENGEEKYGYHYNETIMNMLFNDYILNSPQYLQKYKNAIPKEKKRRDKSGINQLKKQGAKKMGQSGLAKLQKTDVDESSTAGSAGGAAGYTGYAGPSAWSTKGDLLGNSKSAEKIKKPIWKGGTVIQESNYLTDPSGFEKYIEALNEEFEMSFDDNPLSGAETTGKMAHGDSEWRRLSNNDFAEFRSEYGIPNSAWVTMSQQDKENELRDYLNINEQTDADFVLNNSQAYGSIDNMHPNDQKIIKTDIQNRKFDNNNNIKDGIALQEKAKSKSQQRFMGMVNAVQKGELSPDEVGDSVEKAADNMTNKDAEDFASTKHKGLPEKVDEYLSQHDTVQYISDMNGENPFMMGDIKWQFVKAKYPNGKIDIGVYRFGHDLVYDYARWMEEYNINENNIKEDTQTMIQNNGTSMSNKAQPTGDQSSGVPVGMQATNGLNESDIKLLEDINKELEAFSIHHNKLKLMSEERKTTSQILNQRVGDENAKNFKKDIQHSGTKDIIDVEKELEWKDQQTDVNDPQKLGQDIEKTEIKSTDAKGEEALKNVGNSANDKGDEIPKRNLTTDEQDEVNLYRNGLHSTIYDNEPNKRFEDRMKADMGDDIYKMREKQLAFKGKAPMYNKDTQPIDDGIEKSQFDKNKSGWNDREGLKESMITGRYIDALGKRRLIEFRLNEAVVSENTEDFFVLDFTGLGNTYNNKTVDNKVTVNETVVSAIDSHKFYTDGKSVVAVKNPVQNLNESDQREMKMPVNEQMEKMKHLLGYKPDSFTNTSNVKKNRGF